MKYNPHEMSYFQKEERKGTVNEFSEPIQNAFNEISKKSEVIKKKLMINYASIDQHPFLGNFLLNSHDLTKLLENENECCDQVFMEYLNKMSVHINPKYFTHLIVFVTLFREYVNQNNKDQAYPDMEFTMSNTAEDVPELSNDFINNFLEPEVNDFGFSKEEAIDLTQNFCHWMYENNFTCSKLSLINNDK